MNNIVSGYTVKDRDGALETLKRVRRIETKLTRLAEASGVETGASRPWWNVDCVIVPSQTITIEAMMDCIPEGWTAPVDVVHEDEVLFTIKL